MFRAISLLCLFFSFWYVSHAQVSGVVDPTFNVGKSFGPDRYIHTVASVSDDKFVLGWFGNFFSNYKRNGLARFTIDGEIDENYNVPDADGRSFKPYFMADNSILLASHDGSKPFQKINRINQVDLSFTRGNTRSRDFAVTPNGGFFETPMFNSGILKKYLSNGRVDSSFRQQRVGFEGFCVLSSGSYLAIKLDSSKVKRYLPNGELDRTYTNFFTYNDNRTGDEAIKFKELPDGKVMIWQFNSGLWRHLPNGQVDASFSPVFTALGIPVAFTNGGSVYVSRIENGRKIISRFGPNGRIDPTFQATLSFPEKTQDAGSRNQQFFFCLGEKLCYFGQENQMMYRFVRFSDNGEVEVLKKSEGLDGPANILVLQPDKKLLVAGQFRFYNAFKSPALLRLMPNGEIDGSFQPKFKYKDSLSPGYFPISNLSTLANGRLLVHTNKQILTSRKALFSDIYLLEDNGDTVRNWRLDSSTVTDTRGVLAQVVDAKALNDKIYVLANIVSGLNSNFHVFRFLENGQRDTSFVELVEPMLTGMHVLENGEVFVDLSNGKEGVGEESYIVKLMRLLPDGKVDTTFKFDPVLSNAGWVSHLQFDGENYCLSTKSYGSGSGSSNPPSKARLFKLNSFGKAISGFASQVCFYSSDSIFSRQKPFLANNKIGLLASFNIDVKPGFSAMVKRLNTMNQSDTMFNELDFGYGYPMYMTQADSIYAYIGGYFNHVSGNPINGIVRIKNQAIDPTFIKFSKAYSSTSIFPNPGRNSVRISGLAKGEKAKFQMFSLDGRLELDEEIAANADVNTSKLSPGLHLVRLRLGTKTQQFKWIKE